MNDKTKNMVAIALILISVIFMIFILGKPKKVESKPSQYDSVFAYRIGNIKKIDSIKPEILEKKQEYQKKARQKSVEAKAKIAQYKQSLKDGDTIKAVQYIDSAVNTFLAVDTMQGFVQSYADTLISKQATQIAAYEGLLTMTRTEMNRLDTQVKALQFENKELKDKAKKRKRLNILLTGIIISIGYLIAK